MLYKAYKIPEIGERPRLMILDEVGNIINRNPTKFELRALEIFPYKNRGHKLYDKKQLIEFIRTFYEENGMVPLSNQFNEDHKYPSSTTYFNYFGSWNRAIEMAGLWDKRIVKDVSDDKLLECLIEFYKENGRTPTEKDFSGNPNYPNYNMYIYRFGYWNRALVMAGLQVNYLTKITDKEMLDYLKFFYKENGRVPKKKDFDGNPNYPACMMYVNRFGRWNRAIEMAGLQVNMFTKLSDKEMLEYLKLFYKKNRRTPRMKDFECNPNYPSCNVYVSRYGSWQNALKLVDLDIDSMVNNGIVETNQQKGRLSEICIRDSFLGESIDLSGDNCQSPFDGICPKGDIYDVKSSKLYATYGFWQFGLGNEQRDEIIWIFLVARDEYHKKILHVWMIPGDLTDKANMTIGINCNYRYNIENMKEYEITHKFKI